MKLHKKISATLIVIIAGTFLVNEVSYAWIAAAAGAAARRVRKNTQQNKDEQLVNINNTVCPVSGDKVNMKNPVTVEYKGEAYNLCCPMCIDIFNKDPEKYSAIAKKQVEKK